MNKPVITIIDDYYRNCKIGNQEALNRFWDEILQREKEANVKTYTSTTKWIALKND